MDGSRVNMLARNRRRIAGRTNLKQVEEQETKASLERKRLAKEKERERKKETQSGKTHDADVVDKMLVDLRERFYEKGSLAKNFRDLDEDLSGSISSEEFQQYLQRLGHTLTPSQMNLLLSRADADNNNCVDLDEFCATFDLFTSGKDGQGFSNVNTAIGEIEHVGVVRDQDKEASSGNEEGPEDRNGAAAASTSHEDSGDHDDVMVRVHSIVSQLKRKVAQKGSMRTVFREYDANHDGSISRDEFRDALNNLNLRVTDRELFALDRLWLTAERSS